MLSPKDAAIMCDKIDTLLQVCDPMERLTALAFLVAFASEEYEDPGVVVDAFAAEVLDIVKNNAALHDGMLEAARAVIH